MLARMWRKRNTITLLVGMQTVNTLWKTVMEVPQDIKNRATLQPSNYTTEYLLQRYRCNEKKGHMHPNVYLEQQCPQLPKYGKSPDVH